MAPELQPRPSYQPGAWGSVVHTPHGGHRGGEATGQASADLSVILGFGLQEHHGVLEGAGRLQAQGVHHVDQVVCGVGADRHSSTDSAPRGRAPKASPR